MASGSRTERKVRLFLQRGRELDYRYLAWFTLAGGDFYWGPAQDAPDVPSVSFSGAELSIEVPEELAGLPRHHWKASRHASGLMHITTDGRSRNDRTDVYVGAPTQLDGPTRFAILIEKPANRLPPYFRALDRGGASAVVVRLDADTWERRTYWEFFLSPAGSWPVPPWALGDQVSDRPILVSLGPDPDVVLAVRHASLGGRLNAWQPDVGLWLNLYGEGTTDPSKDRR